MKRTVWITLAALVALPPTVFLVHRTVTPHEEAPAPASALDPPSSARGGDPGRPLDGDFDRAMKRDTARAASSASSPPP